MGAVGAVVLGNFAHGPAVNQAAGDHGRCGGVVEPNDPFLGSQ